MPKPSSRRQLEADLQVARAELAAAHTRESELLATSESLSARVSELESHLEARPVPVEAQPTFVSEDDEGSREAQLARRIAELEAARVNDEGAGRDADDAAARARELAERVQSLELQLESARLREGDLTTRTVHADGLLADLGLRLADLGTQADQAEQLTLDLERAREEAAFALSVAREDATAAREELGEVRAELGAALETAEGRIADLDSAHRAAVERADSAEARAEEAETRASVLEHELAAATSILENLEHVYAAVRDRVDAGTEGLPATPPGIGAVGPDAATAAHAEMQGQLESAITRVQVLEQELQESVEVLREQVRDLTDRVSDAEVVGHRDADSPTFGSVESATFADVATVTDAAGDGTTHEAEGSIDASSPVSASAVQYLSVTDLLAIGERELGLGTPVDLAALEAVAALPCAQDDGQDRFPGVHVKAAALLAEILHRRPFVHGNDRVALMTVVVFLSLNGYGIDAPEEDLAELTRIVADGELPLLHIAATLEAASTPVPAPTDELRMEG